jgi:membrane protein
VYAGFAFVVAALLWTYFGWLILLAGAQLSFYVQNPAYLRLGLQGAAPLERGARAARPQAHVLRRRARMWPAAGELDGEPWLANELGLPGISVAQMAATLERAGLVIVSGR